MYYAFRAAVVPPSWIFRRIPTTARSMTTGMSPGVNGPRELIALARPSVAPIAPSLLGTLQRHGPAIQNANTDETVERLQRAVESAFSQMYEYVRAGGGYSTRGAPRLNTHDVAQEPTWSPTEQGEQVFLRFRDAGTDLDDVWTAGPDGVTAPGADSPPAGELAGVVHLPRDTPRDTGADVSLCSYCLPG